MVPSASYHHIFLWRSFNFYLQEGRISLTFASPISLNITGEKFFWMGKFNWHLRALYFFWTSRMNSSGRANFIDICEPYFRWTSRMTSSGRVNFNWHLRAQFRWTSRWIFLQDYWSFTRVCRLWNGTGNSFSQGCVLKGWVNNNYDFLFSLMSDCHRLRPSLSDVMLLAL